MNKFKIITKKNLLGIEDSLSTPIEDFIKNRDDIMTVDSSKYTSRLDLGNRPNQ